MVKSRWLLAVGCGTLLVAALAVGGVFAWRSYQAYVAEASGQAANLGLSVWVNNPQDQSQLPAGSQILVEANGHGPNPIVLMELWGDGQFIEAASSPDGLTPGGVGLHWQPLDLGEHTLFVRGYDSEGKQATSTLVRLASVDPADANVEDADMAYAAIGPSAPSGGGGGGGGPAGGDDVTPISNPEPPDPVELQPPDGEGPVLLLTKSPDLFDWIGGFIPAASAPAPPNLNRAVEGCKVRLFIGDQSDNEAGFKVYRQGPGMNNFSQVATLESYPGPAFTWEQQDQYGQISYYVTAYNNQGEAASNVVSVGIEDENCAPDNGPILQISLVDFGAPQPIPQSYCYYSLGGAFWDRYPSNPNEYFPFSGDDPLPLAEYLSSDEADFFALECWGWIGGDLELLGKWEWDLAEGGAGPATDTTPGSGAGDVDIGIAVDDAVITESGPPEFHLPTHLYIPVPYPWWSSSPQTCADYGGIANPIVLGLICGDVADDIDFVVWITHDSCPAVSQGWAGECYTQDDIIGYRVYDTLHNGGNTPVDVIDAPLSIYFLIEDNSCAARHVQVSSLVEEDGEILESQRSYNVYYPGNPDCPFLTGAETRDFSFSWDTIDFSVGNIDDGVDAEDDAEGYGYLKVWTQSGFVRYFTLSEMGHSIAESLGGIEHANVYEFDDDDGPNPYSWPNIPLAQTTGGPCQIYLSCSYGTGNHHVIVPLYRDDVAYVTVRLWDADPDQNDDKICHTNTWAFSADSVDLAGGTQSGDIAGNHSSAHCVVDFHVNATD